MGWKFAPEGLRARHNVTDESLTPLPRQRYEETEIEMEMIDIESGVRERERGMGERREGHDPGDMAEQ